jgi:medium-chain acyl-[acyl-carrier-protein] hydrolase
MTALDASCWLEHRHPMPTALIRLYCFPFAGGSASFYYGWGPALAPEIEVVPVQLPGRGRLADLPHTTDIHEISDALAGMIADDAANSPTQLALCGHSMGAIIAFEVARRLERARFPVHRLIATGRPAPHIRSPEHPVSGLDRSGLIDVLRAYGATPEEVLADDELLDLALPTVRADFRMIERYAYRQAPGLRCPLSAIGGTHDPGVPSDAIRAWRRHTVGPFDAHLLPGGHFFPLESGPAWHRLLRALLTDGGLP